VTAPKPLPGTQPIVWAILAPFVAIPLATQTAQTVADTVRALWLIWKSTP
jgi:hypothetical protein